MLDALSSPATGLAGGGSSSATHWLLALVIGVKCIKVLGLYVAYDLLKSLHLVTFLFITLGIQDDAFYTHLNLVTELSRFFDLKTPVPKPNSDSLSSWKFRIPIAQTKFLSLLSEWENDGQKSPSPTTTRIRDKSQGKCLPPPVKVQVLDLTRGLNAISQDILEETDESFSVQIQKSASIECEICHKLISRPWFPQHERIHLADVERHACHICGAQFTRKGDVKRHQKRVHGKELGLQSDATTESNSSTREILKCQVCQAKFHKRKYYEDHIKIIHPISTSTGTTEGKRTSENGNVTDGIKEVVQSEEHSLIVSQDQLQNNHLDRHEEDEDQNSSNSSPNSEYVEQKSSQDNVQTLIDAVQELIQSHDEGNLVTTPNSNEES